MAIANICCRQPKIRLCLYRRILRAIRFRARVPTGLRYLLTLGPCASNSTNRIATKQGWAT